MQTPLGFFADRFELSPRVLRIATTTALIVSIVIVFTGGLVRVTGSGLGCPTWPTCDGTSITSTADLGIHGAIEFANRVLTSVIIIAVAFVIVAARLQRPRVRSVTRLAWSQFWLVMANAVAGGITVLVKLNPWVVAMHFLLAIALLTTAALTWHRVRENRQVAVPAIARLPRVISVVLTLLTAVLIIFGTLVSGTGPHSGDSADVPRMQLDWLTVTIVHGVLGASVLILAIVLLVVLGRGQREALVRKRVIVFLVVVALQGLIGIVQAATGLPEGLVSFHLLGSALVLVGVLRVLLDANPTLFASVGTSNREHALIDA